MLKYSNILNVVDLGETAELTIKKFGAGINFKKLILIKSGRIYCL